MSMSVRQLNEELNSLKIQEHVYINAINLSECAIELLRGWIKSAMLIPVEEEVRKMMKPEVFDKVMDGTIICPQMTYFRNWVGLIDGD